MQQQTPGVSQWLVLAVCWECVEAAQVAAQGGIKYLWVLEEEPLGGACAHSVGFSSARWYWRSTFQGAISSLPVSPRNTVLKPWNQRFNVLKGKDQTGADKLQMETKASHEEFSGFLNVYLCDHSPSSFPAFIIFSDAEFYFPKFIWSVHYGCLDYTQAYIHTDICI